MEQYLLCMLNCPLSERNATTVTKYLNTLFPASFQYEAGFKTSANFVESVALLLKPISRHVAVLNTCQENLIDIKWKSLNEDINILDTITDGVTTTDSAIKFDSQADVVNHISTSLHSLADQLPAFGTYRLEILLGSDVLRELSVRREPTLVSAFIRLTRWHSAHFTIFEQNEFDTDRLNEWCEIIDAHILLQDSKLDLGPPLWTGAIQFQSSNNEDAVYKGFHLRLDLDHYVHSHIDEDSTNLILEHIILSSKLQVIDEISFASIPPYLISPIIFKLHLSKLNIMNENSSSLIEYLLINEKVAFIVKLGYAEVKEKAKTERKYCTSRWQKAISSSHLKDAECYVSSFEKFITFAITKSTNSDYIVAYPLQDTKNLDASFYFSIINHRVSNMTSQVPKEKCDIEIPIIDRNMCQIILKHLKQCYDNSQGNINFSSLLESIKHSPIISLFKKTCVSNFSFEEIDPSDWPERIQLLHKQMKKEHVPTNPSLVQHLKLPQQSLSFSSNNITEHFLPSGDLKDSKKVENVYSIKSTDHLVTCNMNDVLESKWPEIMTCFYHDLYYNSSYQSEDKESLGSQLVKLYVQHETASTCTNQQLTQNFQIVISEKVVSPSKAFRGPSSRVANVSNEIKPANSRSPKKNALKDLITKKILSTSHNENFVGRKSSSRETSRRNSQKKSLVAVRCSPRKKNPINYKYPSVNRNNKSSSNLESNVMSDLLRKKIRYAVAKALEDNGINSSHPMYQSCGAKLLTICRTFLDDLKLKKGKTSEYLQKIADAHVKQVIEFYQD